MKSKNCLLLEREGFLMQGCFKSSLASLQSAPRSEEGPFYVAFFNFSIGLERLLKLILILDHCRGHSRRFPDWKALKDYGHDINKLYKRAEGMFQTNSISVDESCKLDDIDHRLLAFLAGFAKLDRYYNLDTLTGGGKSKDPMREWGNILRAVYENDVPELDRLSNEEQVEAAADLLKDHTTYVPSSALDGTEQSYDQFYQYYGMLEKSMPHVLWRLVKLLVPLKGLLLTHREELHASANQEEMEIPYLEEFLDFVGPDRATTFSDSDWPY